MVMNFFKFFINDRSLLDQLSSWTRFVKDSFDITHFHHTIPAS